jgi:hypothetical protein
MKTTMVFRDCEIMSAYFDGIQTIGDYEILNVENDINGIVCTFNAWAITNYQSYKRRFNTFEELENHIEALRHDNDIIEIRNITIQESMKWELDCEILKK